VSRREFFNSRIKRVANGMYILSIYVAIECRTCLLTNWNPTIRYQLLMLAFYHKERSSLMRQADKPAMYSYMEEIIFETNHEALGWRDQIRSYKRVSTESGEKKR
jgi:hypothetical protein